MLKKLLLILVLSFCLGLEAKVPSSYNSRYYIEKLKKMFSEVVVQKNASKIPEFYHKNFLLYSNGMTQGYEDFLKSHEEIFLTAIKYRIEFDEVTFIEEGEKIACRVWITTENLNESPKEIEVILIAEYQDHKIYKIWELTYPDWSKLPAFKEY